MIIKKYLPLLLFLLIWTQPLKSFSSPWLECGSTYKEGHVCSGNTTKYEIDIDGIIYEAKVHHIKDNQCWLWFDLEFLDDGDHTVSVRAGNDCAWSPWTKSLKFTKDDKLKNFRISKTIITQ